MALDSTVKIHRILGRSSVLFLCLFQSVAFQPRVDIIDSPQKKSQGINTFDQQSTSKRRTFSSPASTILQRHAPTATSLSAKLWDRLQVEEDPEPYWYLLNCVAGLELDLLKQCRDACEDLPDCVKFVVPTEKKTRSHGANRMVTETKVKYQGYVFAKLRLCAEVYETIQSLDLCRSWMGTVNHKGYNKLPPAPVALNDLEVENFGLEEHEDEDEESIYENAQDQAMGVILDTAENEAKGERKVDQEALKAYLGLKVEDMVKVTAKGKFFNEDGIVRRLKDGKIFVRFYTYGTMFEEWLDPSDVRKLSSMEILKGLSGPSEPVTQRDFDQREQGGGRSYSGNRPFDRPQSNSDLRQSLMGNAGMGPRNRRQDRNERNFRQRRDHFGRSSNDEEARNERNWSWYQDQQRSRQRDDAFDGETGMISGSERQKRESDWAIGNVDSQWGRGGRNNEDYNRARQNNRYQTGDRRGRNERFGNNRRDNNNYNNNRQANRQTNAAIQGDGDWSAFVSNPSGKNEGRNDNSGDEDNFFSSLMNDLSPDSKKGRGGNQNYGPSQSASEDDDFFDSLLEDLKADSSPKKSESSKQVQRQETEKTAPTPTDAMEDDFFSSLEAELGSALDTKQDTKSSREDLAVSDDFFAQLEAELAVEPSKPKRNTNSGSSSSSDDLFAALEMEMESSSPPPQKPPQPQNTDSFAPTTADDDFFASLESELDSTVTSSSDSTTSEKQTNRETASFDGEDFFASLESELKTSGATSPSDIASDNNQDVFAGPVEKVVSNKPLSKESSSKKQPSTTSVASASSSSMGDLQKQTVPVLKDMLRERGLKVSGKKAELIERLMQ